MSGYLKGFTRKENNLYNFRCPICGDSKKKQMKQRGYIHKHKGNWFFTCHNCNDSMSFKTFMHKINPSLFKEYMLETVGGFKKQKKEPPKKKFKLPVFDKSEDIVETVVKPFDMLADSVESLPDKHPVKTYLKDRHIPFDGLYYTHEFFTWVNKHVPEKFKYISADQGRIIIPLKDKDGVMFGVQGRALDPNVPNKYITIKFDDEADKIYGLDKVDSSKTVYVLEGVFDSLFIENSVATTDSNYVKITRYLKDVVIIPDTDVRNIHIIRSVDKCIKAGLPVCLLPQKSGKDINDMIKDGISIEDIMKDIKKYTFKGITARLEFNRWNKT